MSNLGAEREIAFKGDGEPPRQFVRPVKGGAVIYKGAMVGVADGTGLARRLYGSSGLIPAGIATATIDASVLADSVAKVPVVRGVFERPFGTSTDAFTEADYGVAAYAIDDQTLGKTDGDGTRPFAGYFLGLNADTGEGLFYLAPHSALNAPCVRSRSMTFAAGDFSAAATSQIYLIGEVLPKNVRLIGAEIKCPTLLSGGSVSACTVSLGDYTASSFTASIASAVNCFTGASGFPKSAVGATYPDASGFGGLQLAARINTTSDNVAALTAGSLKVHLLFARAA